MNAPRAYYNEIDPEAVEVLRELIASNVIAAGDVDSRSIKDVNSDDIAGYTQCHFFAGAGLWSIAARLAGWSDDKPLWTASCPCQPFSAAGKQGGADDARHLWPDLYRIVRTARAAGQHVPVLVGEQVAGAAGYGWFDGVRADLAREGIAARTVDIPACAVDAPHERNRLWWCALLQGQPPTRQLQQHEQDGRAVAGHADGSYLPLGYAIGTRLERQRGDVDRRAGRPQSDRPVATTDVGDRRNGTFWSDAEWITCHDGKARRAKPGISMLVDGMAGRIGLWRLAGNSIVPQLAAEVIASILDVEAQTLREMEL
jgi:DNA (cytosine-5)-methyltransferase 1